jgi:hypothetical protein
LSPEELESEELEPEEPEPDEPEPDELELDESVDLEPLPELLADLSDPDEELSEDELSPPLEPFVDPAGTVLPLPLPLRLSVR